MPKSRILFLYYDPHYFHAALAKAIGAKPWPAPTIRSSEKSMIRVLAGGASSLRAIVSLPRDYDVYFCEGTFIFPAMAKRLGLLKKGAKIINIVSSPLFYYMKTGRVSGARRSLAVSLLREVDGFVCVGKMEEQLLKHFSPNAKTIVTYPFIRREVVRAIAKEGRPQLNTKEILFVGNRDTHYKGLDLLLAAFRKAREKVPGLRLTIVGDYDSDVVGPDREGIRCIGKVRSTARYIKGASLYVHLGRGEAFGVSVMEALLAGLPVLVSDQTGAKELIYGIDKRMVVPLDASAASARIAQYFMLSTAEKGRLARKGIEMVKRYSEDLIIRKFKDDYQNLLKAKP
ncbi:MAG: glycosyltransferase family 4 protein [Candidatus Micrarchaeota archaeon]|nr:glycosyltransferase family 4 protein [Candidatus Micrarchaeota archaeon]